MTPGDVPPGRNPIIPSDSQGDHTKAADRHHFYMGRAIALARKGIGWCSPNPPVGAVLVKDGAVIGEGFHAKAGGPHAEVVAIASATNDCSDATLYVTLEPCNHHGRTPPCTEAILSAGISEVIVAVRDPNPTVRGGGIDTLRSHGVVVQSGVLENEATELIRAFAFHAATQRPYVFAKFAASLDGKVATHTGESQWITGKASRERVHELRHAVDAILVGVDTVIADDPLLTARRSEPSNNPQPIVLDSRGRIGLSSKLVQHAPENTLIVVTTDAMSLKTEVELKTRGCMVWRMPTDTKGRVSILHLLSTLGEQGIQSLLVEGGPTVLGSFFDDNLVNEIWAFIAPFVIGGANAPGAVAGIGLEALDRPNQFERKTVELLDQDVLVRLTAKQSSYKPSSYKPSSYKPSFHKPSD